MTFRHFISALIVAAVALPVVAAAQSQGPAKPTEQKPAPAGEKPAAVNIAGKWTVTIDLQGQQRTSTLDLKVEGTKLTGTINSELGEAQLAGEFADGKLKFGFTMDANGTPLPELSFKVSRTGRKMLLALPRAEVIDPKA